MSFLRLLLIPFLMLLSNCNQTAFAQYNPKASQISNAPSGNVSSTNVQSAINELDTEKVPTTRTVNGQALSGNVTVTTVTGNAGTATAFDHTPTHCNSGYYPNGIDSGGNAVNCAQINSASWGSITGTLSSQTDLQTALDAKLAKNSSITGATKTKITYDTKGLVTSGSDATTADISDSTDKRYVTDAQRTVIGNTSGTNTGDQDLSGLVPYTGASSDVNLGAHSLTAKSVTATDSSIAGKLNLYQIGGVYYVGFKAPDSGLSSSLLWTLPSSDASGFFKSNGSGTISLDTSTYLTAESDPVYLASSWYSTTNNSSNWNTAYGWGNHASAGYETTTALGSWAGSTNLTTLGTISTGVWHGTAIADSYISSASTWNAKQNAITTGTTAQYLKGDLSLGTLNQAAVAGLTTADSPTFTGENLSGLTASQIVATDSSKNLSSLAVATYPSLTELSYVKGVTSAVQTQINAKQASLSLAAGTYTDGKWCSYASSGTLLNCNNNVPQVNLGLIAGTLTDGKMCTYTSSGTLLACNTTIPTSSQWTLSSSNLYSPSSDTVTVGYDNSTSYDAFTVNTNSGAGGGSSVNYVATGQGGIDSYTVLLLHFDNNLTDSEITPKTVTNHNSTAFTSTAGQYEFGGYGINFASASSNYLTIPYSVDFAFGSGDFTYDFWIRMKTNGTNQYIYDRSTSNAYNSTDIWMDSSNKLNILTYDGSANGTGNFVSTNTFIADTTTLHHVAIVRSGSSCYMFLDGVSQAVTQSHAWGTLTNDGTAVVSIGYLPQGYNLYYTNAYIDEFRVSKGIARWTANFTPPAASYTRLVTLPAYRLLSGGTQTAKIWTDGNNSDQLTYTVGTTDVETQTTTNTTLNTTLTLSAKNIITDTTTGSSFGTGTTQKTSAYGVTPVVQGGATTDLGTILSNWGLRASGTAYPITTSGAVNLSGSVTHSAGTTLSGSGGLTISDTTAAGTCTSSASTTCTATVRSGCKPVCSETTAISTTMSCAVASTTLTCTFGTLGTNTCNFICF